MKFENCSIGQLNYADNNSVITSIQINSNDYDEISRKLDEAIGVAKNVGNIDAEDKLKSIKDNCSKGKLTKEKISEHIKTLAAILSVSNGIPTLCKTIGELIELFLAK